MAETQRLASLTLPVSGPDFDLWDDCPPGTDPDVHSPRLRESHRRLWSKALPNGRSFELRTDRRGVYLHHQSALSEFLHSSDCVVPSFRKNETTMKSVFAALGEGELDSFVRTSYTIGGMMMFPGNKADGKMTINGPADAHPRIMDRFDLTVECIGRHYQGGTSPLSSVLGRYDDFFRLFESFATFVDFFHLQDFVTVDAASVKFFTPFDDFERSPLPATLETYRAYVAAATSFLRARGGRMVATQRHGMGRWR